MVAQRQAFLVLRGCPSVRLGDSRFVQRRKPVCAKEVGLGVTSVGGLLKAKRDGDGETKSAIARKCGLLAVSRHGLTCDNSPPKLSKCLLKRSALEAAYNEEFGRFGKILLRFGLSPSLSSNVKWRAMGYIPAVLLLHDAEKLELCLNHCAHTWIPGRGTLTSPRLYIHGRCIVNDSRCSGM